MIGPISKINWHEEQKQANTHMVGCEHLWKGGAKSIAFGRTHCCRHVRDVQQIAGFRQISAVRLELAAIEPARPKAASLCQRKARQINAIKSISTRTFFGRRDTSTVERAGLCAVK